MGKILATLVLLCGCIGCTSGDKAKQEGQGAKTSMGQAAESARDVSRKAQDRAKEMDGELDEDEEGEE